MTRSLVVVCIAALSWAVAADTSAEGAVTAVGDVWIERIVEVVRRTREHPDLRVGSSVRGAIDASVVAATLSSVRGLPPFNPSVGLDATLVALSGRVRVREGSTRTSEDVVTELWQEVFGRVEGGDGDEGKGGAPTGATRSH